MFKLVALLTLLVTPILSEPKPDLTVPATITGVSTGSLDTNGNIVANVDRILTTLNQFHSIVQSLYYIQTPELAAAADNFRYVMDSLVEAGSPIFQGLSNVAKVSSGNVERSFDAIKADIKQAVQLNDRHVAMVNGTRVILGDNTTDYFDATLSQLAASLSNVTELLDRIQSAVVQIQQLNPKTQAGINALVPNNDIRALNAVLRQYIQIGDAAIPQVRSVVNRVQSVDSFVMRLRSLFDQRRRDYNATANIVAPYIKNNVINVMVSGLNTLRSQVVERSTKAAVAVSSLMLNDNTFLKEAANQDVPEIQAYGAEVVNITERLAQKINTLTVKYELPLVVMNLTAQELDKVAREVSLAMTQRVNKSDTCFAQYNYQFDTIPRTIYSQLYDCLWSTAYDLNQVARYISFMTSLAATDASYRLSAVDKCTSMINRNSNDMQKYQAASCLTEVKKLLTDRRVFREQMGNYDQLLVNEVSYSSPRYDFCLGSTLQQAYTQIAYLRGAFNQCVGVAPAATPMKFRVRGKVTVSFG